MFYSPEIRSQSQQPVPLGFEHHKDFMFYSPFLLFSSQVRQKSKEGLLSHIWVKYLSDLAKKKSFLRQTLLRTEHSGHISNGYFSLHLVRNRSRFFFSSIHSENLLGILGIKFTKNVNISPSSRAPGAFNSQTCLHSLQPFIH